MELQLDDINFKKFRDIIYEASGINFTKINRPILESRLKEKLKKLGIQSYEEYYKLISANSDELKSLLDFVTTNLTKFFRNTSQFDALENFVVNDLVKIKKTKQIKVWSAGCSTGEEAYTIAMILKDKLSIDWNIQIIASDISFNSLMKAKEGFYPKDRVVGIPDNYLKKYLIEIGEGYYIKDDIKELIQFDYHNLKNDPTFTSFDIVFCRNVIIYFDSVAQERVINQIYETMSDYSYLFIGHSESLFGMKTNFIFTKIDNACLYMKKKGVYGEQKS